MDSAVIILFSSKEDIFRPIVSFTLRPFTPIAMGNSVATFTFILLEGNISLKEPVPEPPSISYQNNKKNQISFNGDDIREGTKSECT